MAEDVKLTKLAECAGCGAKVGAGELAKLFEGFPASRDPNLLVGFDHSDDAAVYRVAPGVAIAQTLDFFPPIVDDPYVFGQIAAANALSDIYAMGARPVTALNILAVPEDMPSEAVRQILRGGAEKVAEAGASVAGGHSIYDEEPKYGLSVTGVLDPEKILANDGAEPGDVLIATKPFGVGVVTTGQKAGLASPEAEAAAVRNMVELNRAAAEAAAPFRVHGCTDVTGFGAMGHCLELAQGSGTRVHLDASAFAFLPQAVELAEMGILPAGLYRNRRYAEPRSEVAPDVPLAVADLLYDPQTSGGLLFSVDAADADALMAALGGKVLAARRVGRVEPYEEGGPRVLVTMGL